MKIVAFDLSLTATGVCFPDGSTDVWRAPERTRSKGEKRSFDDDMVRLDWLHRRVVHALHDHAPELCVIEGYSMGSQMAYARASGELGGIVRLAIWRQRITLAVISPASLKKFAVNSAKADKSDMAVAAVREGWTGTGNDAADAWWLRSMASYQFDLATSYVDATAYRDEACSKVAWPVLNHTTDAA